MKYNIRYVRYNSSNSFWVESEYILSWYDTKLEKWEKILSKKSFDSVIKALFDTKIKSKYNEFLDLLDNITNNEDNSGIIKVFESVTWDTLSFTDSYEII